MAVCQIYKGVWCSIMLNIILILVPSASQSADLLSRCSPLLPRTTYLKASDWGKCYEFHLEERTWWSANNICSAKGGHLVTIKEERVQRFLVKALSDYRWPRNGLWIGATDKEKEMEWLWVTGERVEDGYSRWAPGQPSCGFLCFEDCALMRWKESGRWHDYRCSWLEDYSFICEYNMMPEPTTSRVVITTTATLTQVVSANATSALLTPSAIPLTSEYLFREHTDKVTPEKNNTGLEPKNDTTIVFPAPAVMIDGINGARAEQVQENVSTSSSGMDSGSLAFIVIAVLVILVAGLCLMLVMVRRRHRKLIQEDDSGISYENHYYESSITDKGNSGIKHDTADDSEDEDLALGTNGNAAVGFTVTASLKKQPKQPPALHNGRPKRVMNDYGTAPMVAYVKKSSDKNRNHGEKKPVTSEAIQSLLLPKEASIGYDHLHSQYSNSQLSPDTLQASSQQWYRNEDGNNYDTPPSAENMYYNSYDENIYESVDNLVAVGQQQGHTLTDELDTRSITDEENDRYVPFQFGTPKVS